MWERAKELFPSLKEYILRQENWFEYPTSLNVEFYNPVKKLNISNSFHGWSLWDGKSYHPIKIVEDLNYALGCPEPLGPPSNILEIRKAYEDEGLLIVGIPYVAFENSTGNCWAYDYICTLCNKKSKRSKGGIQGHGEGGKDIPWFFSGGCSCKHAGCKKYINSDCFISEEAYTEYLKYYSEPKYKKVEGGYVR